MALETFSDIWARACERKGGPAIVKSLLPDTLSAAEICEYSDAQLLSVMSKRVFQSGFVWRVVDNKWSAYEQAFFDFVPMKVLMLSLRVFYLCKIIEQNILCIVIVYLKETVKVILRDFFYHSTLHTNMYLLLKLERH